MLQQSNNWAVCIWLIVQVFSVNLYCCHAFNLFGGKPSATKKALGITRIPIRGRYENMTISSLGCGTWSWGNRLLYNYDSAADDELYQAYKLVRDAGVTVFDTADSYGTLELNGRAEILLGEFERQYQSEEKKAASATQSKQQSSLWPFRNAADTTSLSTPKNDNNVRQVATKLAPYPWRITRGNMIQAAKGSLRRIQEDKLAIAQTHWSTANYQPFQEGALWEGLADIYDQNMCDAVGVSNYGPKQLRKIAARMEQRNVPLATAQIQYSLLTYADPLTRDMKPVCDDLNVCLIAYSPLCLGLLTGKYNVDNLPESLPRRQLFQELLPGAQDLLQTLEAVSKDYNKSMSQVAINWAICKNTVPIPGCRTVSQAEQTIDAAVGWRLRPDAMEELDRAALAVKKPMIQNVFQTK